MSNKTLQEQIQELTAKHNHEQLTNKLFPDYKTLAILSGDKKRIVIKAENKAAFVDILSKLPPTNQTHIIGFATRSEQILNTPFRIDIKNPAAISPYSYFKIEVSYTLFING
jgi:hypothetical protein